MERKGIVTQEEVIYYELLKMEKRITEKADLVLKARDEIEQMLQEIRVLLKDIKENAKGAKEWMRKKAKEQWRCI